MEEPGLGRSKIDIPHATYGISLDRIKQDAWLKNCKPNVHHGKIGCGSKQLAFSTIRMG
jgi:hypothetical protein